MQACQIAASGARGRKSYVGAVGLRADGVLVQACNILADDVNPCAHAEARLCRKLGAGAVIWVGRVRRDNGQWAMARPCPTCYVRLRNKGVVKCYYTIAPEEYGTIVF